MKKLFLFIIFFIIFFSMTFIITGCNNNSNNNNISAMPNSTNSYNSQKLIISKPLEETLYSFSTPIQDKSSGRQNNIRLTCSSLNGTIVASGSTFSFCDTVGKATTERGYQKAKIFGADGKVTMGLGGGNCQVSSTLYNALLQDPNFEIVERHPHAGRVYYVEERKRCCSCLW